MRDPADIVELFAPVGRVHIRRMFGGSGIYAGERMFALEVDGEIYLKADAIFAASLRDMGSRPFTYARKDGRVVSMSYWLLPSAAYDDAALLTELAERALAVAGSR